MGRIKGKPLAGVRLVAVVACILLAAGVMPKAAGAEALSGGCAPGSPPGTLTVGSNVRLAETFTASVSGSAVRGEIAVNKNGAGADWIMELLSTDATGAPTNSTLASATVPDATVPIGNSTLAASFTATSSVTAGQQYALSVGRVDGLGIGYVRPDPCPGQEFQSTVGGSSWAAVQPFGGSASDFVVSLFVDPTAPTSSPSPVQTGQRAAALKRCKKKAKKKDWTKKKLRNCKKKAKKLPV